jgi:hypothetical protein
MLGRGPMLKFFKDFHEKYNKSSKKIMTLVFKKTEETWSKK